VIGKQKGSGMIAFDLICSKGHKFECWFKDSASYEEQQTTGILTCPYCNDAHVEKVFSSFGIKRNEDRKDDKKKEAVTPLEALRIVHDYLDKNFEDVGHEFTKEALKIHYGMSKERNIKGEATPDQEKLMKEEGVKFLKVPVLKRLDN
jgi:hypothetical protein